MSEQNKDLEKNYPGSGGAGNEINSQGGFVSGGIGSATGLDSAGASVGSQLGNTATAAFGSTTGANAVNPTGSQMDQYTPDRCREDTSLPAHSRPGACATYSAQTAYRENHIERAARR